MKGDHVEGLFQLFLERAIAVEVKWVGFSDAKECQLQRFL
jgi:hypothetical protein